jgi:hypothetical protein
MNPAVNPFVRTIGNILRLVGISSPQDLPAKPKPSNPPSWRDPQPPKPGDSSLGEG